MDVVFEQVGELVEALELEAGREVREGLNLVAPRGIENNQKRGGGSGC